MVYSEHIEEIASLRSSLDFKVVDHNTVLSLEFEGVSGTATFTDGSYNKLVSTASGGAVILNSVPKLGFCSGDFNGTSSYVTVPYAASLNFSGGPFTIEFWMNTKSITGTVTIIERTHSTAWGSFKVNRWNENVVLYMSSNGTSWDIANGLNFGPISIDTWHHIVITRDATNNILGYRNGVEKFNIATPPPYLSTTGGVVIGGKTSFFYAGRMDNLRLSDIARYTGPFIPPLGAEIYETSLIRDVYNPYHMIDDQIDVVAHPSSATCSDAIVHTLVVITEETTYCRDSVVATIHDSYTVVYSDLGAMQGVYPKFIDDTGKNADIVRLNASASAVSTVTSPIGQGAGRSSVYGGLVTSEHPGIRWTVPNLNYNLTPGIVISAVEDKYHLGNQDFAIETWVKWSDTRTPQSFYITPPTTQAFEHMFGYSITLANMTMSGTGPYTREYYRWSPFAMAIYPYSASMILCMSSNGTSWDIADRVSIGSLMNVGGDRTSLTSVDKWHFIQVTRSGGTIRAFLDGTITATVTVTPATKSLWRPSKIMQFTFGGLSSYANAAVNLDFTGFRISKGTARVINGYSIKSKDISHEIKVTDSLSHTLITAGSSGYTYFSDIYERCTASTYETALSELSNTTGIIETDNIFSPVTVLIRDEVKVQKLGFGEKLDIEFNGIAGQTSNIRTGKGSAVTLAGTAVIAASPQPAFPSTSAPSPSSLFLGTSGYAYLPAAVAGSGPGAEELHWNVASEGEGVSSWASGSMLLDCWFYPTTAGVVQTIFSIAYISTVNGFLHARIEANSTLTIHMGADLESPVPQPAEVGGIKFNEWNHLSFVRYNSSMGAYMAAMYYLNGKGFWYWSQPFAQQRPFNHPAAANSGLYIGTENAGTAAANRFKGYISNFRVRIGTSNDMLLQEYAMPTNDNYGIHILYWNNPIVSEKSMAKDTLAFGGTTHKYIADNISYATSITIGGFNRFRDASSDSVTVTDIMEVELNIFYGEGTGDTSTVTVSVISAEGSVYYREPDAPSSTTSTVTDVITPRINVSPPLNPAIESATLTDTLVSGWTDFEDIPKEDNTATATDTVIRGFSTFPTMATPLNRAVATSTIVAMRSWTRALAGVNSATVTDSILNTHLINATSMLTCTYNIGLSLFISLRLQYKIGATTLNMSLSISNNLSAQMHMIKTINRTAGTFENNIIDRVTASGKFIYSFTTYTTLNLSKKFWGNLLIEDSPLFLANSSVTRIAYEYRVFLDDALIDVTSKIKSCTLSYGIDRYCAEVDITWADYTMYAQVDCSDIPLNYKKERITVFTRIVGVTDWVPQGKFFLEKRSISVVSDSIELTSWGRNKPALLSAPYASPLSQRWDNDTTAKTIALDIIDGLVPLSWEIMDYTILGGNVIAEKEQPIDVISRLAAPVGGIFSADKSGILRVIYRYKDI